MTPIYVGSNRLELIMLFQLRLRTRKVAEKGDQDGITFLRGKANTFGVS